MEIIQQKRSDFFRTQPVFCVLLTHCQNSAFYVKMSISLKRSHLKFITSQLNLRKFDLKQSEEMISSNDFLNQFKTFKAKVAGKLAILIVEDFNPKMSFFHYLIC